MKKSSALILDLLFISFFLSGCNAVGDKAASMSVIYGVTAICSFLLLIGYCCFLQKKDRWMLLLFSSVFIINIGYFALAVSQTLEMALLANRISYLGSVVLPMTMLMIILNVTETRIPGWLPGSLWTIGILMFLIAASPGYLDIYYKEVSLEAVNGVTVLNKVYGPWHIVYLFYLLLYFVATAGATILGILRKKTKAHIHSIFLLMAVFVNMAVWLMEQLVKIDFEFLSVSYIISELFLLSLDLMIQENTTLSSLTEGSTAPCRSGSEGTLNPAGEPAPDIAGTLSPASVLPEKREHFVAFLPTLTPTERLIYNFYLEGKSTKEIMAELHIKENTLKYHNKNIYSKLGVSSRKQLVELARYIAASNE